MPRKSRKTIDCPFLHNMVQGINKEYIFENKNQKKKYIYLMKKFSKKNDVIIIAYCVMDNHAHILTHSENVNNVSKFMKEINSEYGREYNKAQNRVGYVFRDRFKSKTIYSQEYLLKCIKYIHMNPVKAKITIKEEDYEFSSYSSYLNNNEIDSNILKLVFNSEKNYLEKFKNIEYEPLNLEEDQNNLKDVLEKFLSQEKSSLHQIKKNKMQIKKFVLYLDSNEYEFKKQEVADILEISRTKLYRTLRGGKNN